jgi:hypothetical protein
MVLVVGCSGKNISTRDIQPEVLPTHQDLVDVDIFSVEGIKHFDSRVDESLNKDSFSNVVIKPIEFRLPDEKTKKVDTEDKEALQQAFEDAKAVVFEGFPLSDQADPDSLVINTYLTDEIPSYPVVNVALWIIVPSLAVGAAAIQSEAFIGDQIVAMAVGARNGTIGVSGYTKWGVIEQGFRIWLTGIRQWLDQIDASNSDP